MNAIAIRLWSLLTWHPRAERVLRRAVGLVRPERQPARPAPEPARTQPNRPTTQQTAEAAPALEPACYVAALADCGSCTEGCRASQRDWQNWLERSFKRYRAADAAAMQSLAAADAALLQQQQARFGGRPSTTGMPVAVLTIGSSHDEYWQLIGPKGRNMVRKAERAGYTFERFRWNDRLDDIYAVNTSMDERGGKPMSASYRERPSSIGSEAFCAEHGRRYYGAFKDGTLFAYLVLVVFGHFAVVNTILGHGDHLKDGIMNGLIDFLARDLAAEGRVRYVNYLTLRGGRESLDSFKKRVGFAERQAVFLAVPSQADGPKPAVA